MIQRINYPCDSCGKNDSPSHQYFWLIENNGNNEALVLDTFVCMDCMNSLSSEEIKNAICPDATKILEERFED